MSESSELRGERDSIYKRLFDAVFGRWIAAAADLRSLFSEVSAADKRLKSDED